MGRESSVQYIVCSVYHNLHLNSWYCHVDDDMYLNAATLGRLLSKYGDPSTEHVYLGQWEVLEKFYKGPRIADGWVNK